jgi:hypothetical protein
MEINVVLIENKPLLESVVKYLVCWSSCKCKTFPFTILYLDDTRRKIMKNKKTSDVPTHNIVYNIQDFRDTRYKKNYDPRKGTQISMIK